MRVFICGPSCSHEHNAINGPTGCCFIHGPYMYYCHKCAVFDRAAKALMGGDDDTL